MLVGLCQGARLCEIEDVPMEWYADFVQQSFPPLIEDALRKAGDAGFRSDPERAEGTVRQAEFYTDELADYLEDLGIDASVMEAIHRLYEAGVERGRAEHDASCVAELHDRGSSTTR